MKMSTKSYFHPAFPIHFILSVAQLLFGHSVISDKPTVEFYCCLLLSFEWTLKMCTKYLTIPIRKHLQRSKALHYC